MSSQGMAEVIRLANERLSSALRVSMPCTVVDYDHTSQRATVQPVIKRVFVDGRTEDMPVIPDVPVIFPRAGGASLTMPVKPGDGVLVLFADRSIEEWVARGGFVAPSDPRKHDLSDGIAIAGCFSPAVPSLAENNDDVFLTYDGSKIRLKPGGNIEVEANDISVDAGNISVNCLSASVQAVAVNVVAGVVGIEAATAVSVASPAANVTSAIINMISVTSTITGFVTINGALLVNGPVASTIDVFVDDPDLDGPISLRNHTHDNGEVGPPDTTGPG